MNGKFGKATALLATIALAAGGLIAGLAAPASASVQSGCEGGCALSQATGAETVNSSYQLGQAFKVTEPGLVGYICYPNDSASASTDLTDAVALYDQTTSTLAAGATAIQMGTLSCAFMGATLTPGDTYISSYTMNSHYFDASGTGNEATGSMVGLGTFYGSAGDPNTTSGGVDEWGITTQFQSNPNGPDNVTVTPLPLSVSVSVAFTGDGRPGAVYTATCSSPSGTFSASGSGSPIVVTGFTNVASQTISCQVAETVDIFTNLSGLSAFASTTMLGQSGPGCIGTVDAPTNLSAVSEAFPGAVVSWAPVTADPASCLVGYLVTPSSGSPVLVTGHGTTTVIRGLTLGTSYTFTVAAVTGSGAGPASAPTASVTIGAPAAASSVRTARAGKGAIKVAFKPGRNNGAAITRFTATCRTFAAAGVSKSGANSPLTVSGLKAGKVYHCVVRATNSRGSGVPSAVSGGTKA